MLAHPGALGDIELRLEGGRLAPDHPHQAPAVEGDVTLDAGQLQQRGHQVFVLIEARHPQSGGHPGWVPDYQRHVEVRVVQAVMTRES